MLHQQVKCCCTLLTSALQGALEAAARQDERKHSHQQSGSYLDACASSWCNGWRGNNSTMMMTAKTSSTAVKSTLLHCTLSFSTPGLPEPAVSIHKPLESRQRQINFWWGD
jgi:hypothetical protein